MLYRDISRTLSYFLFGLTIPLLIPLFIGIWCEWIIGPSVYPQPPSSFAFAATIFVTLLLAALFRFFGQGGSGHFYRREALLLVLVVYLLTSVIGSLPFLFNGTLSNPVDAFFEAVSGLTTTGATVMEAKNFNADGTEAPIVYTVATGERTTYSYDGTISPVRDKKDGKILLTGVEAVSPALLFWRSFMQWMGGGGIVVLFVAILPALGVGGKVLYQTEVTGPSKESMAPRIKETASQLWKIYLTLTLVEIFLLIVTNREMPLFDAICISLSTVSTGGFAVRNGSIGAYNSASTEWVVILFMLLGSISFSIYFFCMRGKFSRLKDPELKLFLLIVIVTSLFAGWQLFGEPRFPITKETADVSHLYSFGSALRQGAFQLISAQTSTGFVTANYDAWPFSIQTLMLILMFVGAMAGSTAGGLKVIRQQMFFRIMMHKIESIFRPDTVRTYRIGTALIDNRVAMTVLCFFMVAASLTIIGTFLLVFDGVDPETSLSTIACMMNNVGIAFRMAGPSHSFAFLSSFGKLLSAFWMLAGRLEFFALLIAFVPAFWRKT